jgi:hypothetical protein
LIRTFLESIVTNNNNPNLNGEHTAQPPGGS